MGGGHSRRERTAYHYGRAIEWLTEHAPALAAPVAANVAMLREECARLRLENRALRSRPDTEEVPDGD